MARGEWTRPTPRLKERIDYLYRVVDSTGQTLDFLLTAKRDASAAKRFFHKVMKAVHNQEPRVINVDKNAAYPKAINYIHAHLDRDLSLVELASIVNINPTYFASLFKQAMGMPPHQYMIQQRVERAKLMLKKTHLAIADIALRVGFSSQSHLTQ